MKTIFGLGAILDTPAYCRGLSDYEAGKAQDDNPYSPRSTLHAEWREGWSAAKLRAVANENRAFVERHGSPAPFEAGELAAANGLSPMANPYHYGSPAHDAWRRGWASRKAS